MMAYKDSPEFRCTTCNHHFTAHGNVRNSPEGHWYDGGACKSNGCKCIKYNNK